MLSRSNSNAGERLRRAKSMSSTHSPVSGQQRPGTTRLQAELAAVEAYERARQADQLSPLASRPRSNRRRSQISGKSEGSHFEEARRRSASQSDNIRPRPSCASSVARNRQSLPSQIRLENSGEEKVITRRRSVIPPEHVTNGDRTASISTARQSRQRQPVANDGSPAPRYSQCVKDQQATLQLSELGNEVAVDNDAPAPAPPPAPAPRSPPRPARPCVRETQTDEDIRNIATHAYLEDLEQKRVRERKSFIFNSFQKRRATGSNYDTSLPPFNYANDGGAAPIPPHPVGIAPRIIADHKSRHFSSSLRTRLRNAFRKTSRNTSGIPPQQVEAKEFHFTVKNYDVSDEHDGPFDVTDPFMTIAAEEPRMPPSVPHPRPQSKVSTTKDGSAKSRVTSWTNSTVAAISSIRTSTGPFHAKAQEPTPERAGSVRSLRKKSSFLAGPIRNKLRRASKADLKGSEESSGLYSALQKRIRSSKSVDPIHEPLISAPLEAIAVVESTPIPNSRASLPSQQHWNNEDSRSEWASTNRTITPDPAAYGIDVPSPVHEVTSPASSHDDVDATVLHHVVHDSGGSSAQSGLKRRSAVKARPPSQDALARRMERASNRWKSPLDELSPTAPRTTARMSEDNPYELRSFSQTIKQVTPASGLPHHRKAGNHLSPRSDVISPSVYSRATDDASPRPDSPEVYEPTTTITITGHEVRRYSISPLKRIDDKESRGHGSGSWRKWLSDEMNTTLGSSEKPIRLPHSAFTNAPPERQDSGVSSLTAVPGHKRSVASITAELRPVSPLSFHSDDRPGSRASSQVSGMNGPYPVIDPSRNASLHSVATSRRASLSPTRPESPEGRLLHSVAMAKKPSIDAALHSATSVQSRAASKVTGRSQSALDTKHNAKIASSSGRLSVGLPGDEQAERPFNRPRSAYELRVNYKTNANAASKPLEIRRKQQTDNSNIINANSILEDSTLFNIAAGPYAAGSNSPRSPPNPPHHQNQENTRPLDSPLQSLSSAEWLAASSNRKRDARRFTAGVGPSPALLPPHAFDAHSTKKDLSPGQRLVTNWLDERKSRENLNLNLNLNLQPQQQQPLSISKESTPAFV